VIERADPRNGPRAGNGIVMLGDGDEQRFLRGVACFNRGDFFAAHEAWEEIWMEVTGDTRPFYQGLIQVAVCLHHFGNGNTRGARKLFHSSHRYLQPFRPCYRGIDLDRLLGELRRCCETILAGDQPPAHAVLDPDHVPRIDLEPPGTRAAPERTRAD
jgi:uncharacterized protein